MLLLCLIAEHMVDFLGRICCDKQEWKRTSKENNQIIDMADNWPFGRLLKNSNAALRFRSSEAVF